jgi:hypothetical protein
MGSARRVLAVAVLVGGLMVAASPVNATLLSDLTNPNNPPGLRQIQIGDKLFDNFTVTVTGLPTYVADSANIEVMGIDQDPVFGLRFSPATGNAIVLAQAGAYADIIIGFDVTVTDPLFKISGLNLSFQGNAPSDGLAQIVETAYGDSDPPVLLQVSTLGSDNATVGLAQSYSKIRVYKDIAVIAGTASSAQIDEFSQLFHQVPEPAAASLLLVLGGLAFFGRRLSRRRTILAAAVAVGLAGLLIQPSTASAVALSTLDGTADTLTYNNFTFSNFHFNVVGATGNWIADPATIDVQGFTTPDGSEVGLQFAGLIAAMSNAIPSSSVSISLTYDVQVAKGAGDIEDVTMSFNGAPTANDGSAQMGKTVLSDGVGVGGAMVWNQPANLNEPVRLQDHAVLSDGPYSIIQVSDRIFVDGGQSGATTISFINQTFSQVPEPASLALLGLGMPALLYRRKR